MKRKIAWLMSAMMLFSSVPSGSVNVLAESTQQEAEILSDSAGISDAEQNMAEDSIQNVSAEPVQDVSTEVFPEAGEAVEEASVFGDGDEQPDGSFGNDTHSGAQEVTADSIFSDAADSGGEFEPGSETGPEEISIGSNTLNITAGMLKNCKFTAPEDGTYRFRIISEWVSSMTIKDSSWDGLYMEPYEDENFMDWSMEKDEICYVELNVTEGAGETLELSVKRLCEVHTPAEDSVVVTDPTCTEEGYTTYTCEVCEESFTVDYTEASGHQYVETETVEPTCDDYGYTTYTCENCGESYTDNYTDALGHQYSVTEARDATCTEEGYIRYTCDICGEEYDEYVAPYHQLDESGRCTVCQEVSPNVMINADLTVEGEETYIAVEYDAEDYCTACIDIYEEDTEELSLRKTLDADPDENTGKVLIDEELPHYFIIKAYLIDEDTEKTISNTYTNLFHTRAFQELDSYVPADFEEERTVELSGGNFGVFAKDTVVIHGNAEVNTLAETSYEGVTYTLTNTDDHADSIEQGCNLAYFYNDELRLVVHVSGVSRPADRTVTITVEQPALEEVFEHLRIDEVAQDQVCTVDLSGLPQGVSYGSEAAAASTEDAAAAVAGASELEVTQTTLSASQSYSFKGVKINETTKLNGSVSVNLKFPIKLYITDSKQMMQFGVDASLSGNFSVSGAGSVSVPLGEYYVPLLNGVLYLRTRPQFLLTVGGSMSFGTSATGSVRMQSDYLTGFQILSKDFDAGDWKVTVAGNFFCGLQINPELFLLPKNKLLSASLSLGPEATVSLTTPIPEEEQEEGDHTCQACLAGAGNMAVKLSAEITAFKKKASSSTSFKLKGFEFYYSLDHLTGGRGSCPYRKGAQNQQEPYKPDEWDDIGSVVEIGLYDCTLYADGTCVIRNVTAYNTQTIILPSTLTYKDQTYRVTAFDGYESWGYTEATHLVIPESIKKFRYLGNSFAKLETVEFSGSRDKINDFAFSGCEKLKYIEIPDGVKVIGKFAFEDCGSLQSITIPDSVRSVEYKAFSNCSSLSHITLPEGMTSIASEVFLNCSSLTSVVIPDSVKSIGEPVFVECSSLNRIVVGKNVDHVGHLEATVNPSSTNYWDYYNYDSYAKEFILSDGIKFIEANAFEGYENLTHITIPDSVEYIGRDAFLGCISLKNISIPDGVRIGSGAFSGCKSLTDVNLPGDITEIRAYVFEGCDSLNNIVLPDSVLSIGVGAFSDCDSLKSITLPDSVLSIGSGAFYGCDSLNNITLPDGITTIEDCTFADCSSLDSFIILDSIKTIGDQAFYGCSSLKSIIIPDNVESIGEYAFHECSSLTEMTIGKNVKIDCYYGWGCTEALETVYLSEGREEIDDYAFLFCTNLKTIALPDSLKRIGKSAFDNCTSLKEIKLPAGLKEIGMDAFSFCNSFTSVVIPDSVETIGCGAFGCCDNLSEMTIGKNADIGHYWDWGGADTVTTLHLSEGIEEIKDQNFYGYSNLKYITIPGSVKRIGEHAFTWCTNLEKVIMSEGLKEIGTGAFMYCNGLTSFVIPDSVESIGSSTFYNCQNLTDVKLPLGITEIENNLFTYCSSLTSVTIPDNVETIKSGAFLWCSILEKVVIPDSVKTIGNSAFGCCEKLSELTIGKNVEIDIHNWGCHNTLATVHLSEGRTTIGKGSFSNAWELENITIPESVKYIEEEAFSGCKSLSSVIIPNSVETLGKAAFAYCENLTEVTLPSRISIIDEYAFCECSRLSEIILSPAITEIRDCAFASCASLKKVFIPSGVKKIGLSAFSGCTGLTQAVIAGKETNVACYFAFPGKDECPGLKIYGLSGSVAESTATQQNFTPLVRIDEEGHGYVTDRVITPSTCVKPGEHVVKCILCGDCGKTYTEEMPVSDNHEEEVEDPLVPASIGVPGKTAGSHCTACGKTVVEQETIPAIKTVALSRTSYTYNEKMQRPSVTVTDTKGTRLTSAAYTVQYPSGCTNAGTYTVKVIFKGNYKGNKSLSYKILPASQTITVKVSTRTYSYSTVKAKAQTFAVGASAKTALSYKSSNTKYVTVDKNGKVTIKKGTPGGTYKITVTAAKSTNYNAASKDVIIKINPVSQTIKTKVSSKTYKYAAVKAGKQTFSIGATAKTSLSYKSSNTKYVTVSKKGTVTVKKGTPKGTYKVTVTAAKSANYKAATKVITIKVS